MLGSWDLSFAGVGGEDIEEERVPGYSNQRSEPGSLSEFLGKKTALSACHEAIQLSESSQHTQIPFQLTREQTERFIAGCGEIKINGKWPKEDFSLASFICSKLEVDVNGTSDKKVTGPTLRLLDGGIAVVPLYAAQEILTIT